MFMMHIRESEITRCELNFYTQSPPNSICCSGHLLFQIFLGVSNPTSISMLHKLIWLNTVANANTCTEYNFNTL